jgi:hypothetical protein
MKSYHGLWPFSMVQLDGPTSMVRFLQKSNKVTKPLGPSLGRRMWTKRNDHAPKSECAHFLIYTQKGNFEKTSSLTILLSSLVFIFSSPNKNSLKMYYNNIFLPWAPTFSTRVPLLPLLLQNPLDHVSG